MQVNFDSSCAVDFAAYFRKDVSAFELDLSKCTTIEVMEEYQKMKRRLNPRFTYSGVVYNLEALEREMHTCIMPRQITDIFYTLFIQWMHERGVCYSTIHNYCNSICAALRWATRYNCPVHPSFDQYDIPQSSKTLIALTPDEVSHIAHFDLNTINVRPQHRRNLERVRDHFVLSCNLGQRYSDAVRIQPENFDRNIFRIRQQKTGNKAKVDISKFGINPTVAFAILEKYNYTAPYPHDITNYNHYLHELMHHIGQEFDEPVMEERRINGIMTAIPIPKWKKVTSHTARRTFVTYNVTRGLPEYQIRQATGHTDSKSFAQYIKLDMD